MSPNPVSSTPILRTTLVWSAGVTAVLAVAAAVIGFLVAGTTGLWSALLGVLIAAVFLAIGPARRRRAIHRGRRPGDRAPVQLDVDAD